MPITLVCPWVVCQYNRKYMQQGEKGECTFDGTIILATPDEDQVSSECCTEADDLLICPRCTR